MYYIKRLKFDDSKLAGVTAFFNRSLRSLAQGHFRYQDREDKESRYNLLRIAVLKTLSLVL